MEKNEQAKPRWEIGDVALILLALAVFTMVNSLVSDPLQRLLISRFGANTGSLVYFTEGLKTILFIL